MAYGYPFIARRLPTDGEPCSLQMTYLDGRGILREALERCTGSGFAVEDVSVRRVRAEDGNGGAPAVEVALALQGPGSLTELAGDLQGVSGVLAVVARGPTPPRTEPLRRVPGVDSDEVVIKVRDNGPYKITGPVTIVDADGRRLEVPEGPIALCRCGHSARKPFCDKSHGAAGFDSCVRAEAQRR